VKFVREHENRKGVIVCPCKKCLLGKSWSCEVVFAHLTSGAEIIEGYTEWIMHGESFVPPVDNKKIYEAPRTLQVDSIPLHGGSSGVQDMLNDIFAMHDVFVEAGGSQVGVEAEAEFVDVEIEDSNKGANKLEELLKDADTPLHENTKHSKLGAIVRLYSIKCIGGWSNTSFSMLLEFINELMHSDASLPKDTYEAKKYLRDLGIEYEKISACRKGCMLFWRENEKLDKCTFCNESRWKNDLTNEDGSTKSLKKKAGQSVALVSYNIKAAKVVYVTSYIATYEVARSRLYKRRCVEASGRWRSMEGIRFMLPSLRIRPAKCEARSFWEHVL
jgi:hypothetical protein